MAKKLDDETARAVRTDARRLENESAAEGPYPEGTTVTRPNRPSRMFNVRLSEEHFGALQDVAREQHAARVDHGAGLVTRSPRPRTARQLNPS